MGTLSTLEWAGAFVIPVRATDLIHHSPEQHVPGPKDWLSGERTTVHLDDQHTLLNSYANTALGGGASRNRPQSRSAWVSVHIGPDPSLTSPLQALCDALDYKPLGSKLRLHLESRVRTKVPAVCVQRLGWGVQVADRVFLVQDREGCRRVFWEREGNPEQWRQETESGLSEAF